VSFGHPPPRPPQAARKQPAAVIVANRRAISQGSPVPFQLGSPRNDAKRFGSARRIAAVPTGQVAIVAFLFGIKDAIATSTGLDFAIVIAAVPKSPIAVVTRFLPFDETITAVAGLNHQLIAPRVTRTNPRELNAAVLVAAITALPVAVVAHLSKIRDPIAASKGPGSTGAASGGLPSQATYDTRVARACPTNSDRFHRSASLTTGCGSHCTVISVHQTTAGRQKAAHGGHRREPSCHW
jgi:hypothetical protein